MHEERTRIKKFKNNLNYNIKIVSTIGLFIVIINFILLTSFCGVYVNSFKCIVVNVLFNMGTGFFISCIINVFEAIFKYTSKKYLFILYSCCCVGCYCIFNGILRNKEEFNDIDDEDEDNTKNKNKVVTNQTTNTTNEAFNQ